MGTNKNKRSAAKAVKVSDKKVKTSSTKQIKKEIVKDDLQKAKEQDVTSIKMPVEIMRKTKNGYTIEKCERQFGLIKENRPIKKSDVNGFLQIINDDKYDEAQSIVTVEATELDGKYNMVTLQGKKIPKDQLKGYLIVLDGQHRITAYSKLNSIKASNEQITVPNVHVKSGIKNIREYLADINMVGHHWNMGDKICVSAISTRNKTLKKINELIKDGFNATCAVVICTGKRLSASRINSILVNGDTKGLFKEDEKRSEKEMLDFADKFITTAMSINGMKTELLTKRYYIDGFMSFAEMGKDAFKALSKLNINDFKGVRQTYDFVTNLNQALKRK